MRISARVSLRPSWRGLLPVIAVLLVSCGGGGGGTSGPQGDPNRLGAGWITITAPVDHGAYTTSSNRVSLSGSAFISPTRSACCTGLASDTGISVTWSNAATGQSGQAQQLPKYCWLFDAYLCGDAWGASIDLVPGANEIAITASDGTNIGRASITVKSTYDVTPPVITAVNPPSEASVVPLNVAVTGTFDKPINQSTVTSATFLLIQSSGGTVPGLVSYANNAVRFTPSAALAPLTRYTATLTTGIADTFGNHLAAPFDWNFVTGSTTSTNPRFAYVANSGDNSISIFTPDSGGGGLTLTGSAATGTSPLLMASVPNSGLLYVANNGSSDIFTYKIDKGTGALNFVGAMPGSVNWSQPDSMAIDPLGRFLYIMSSGSNALASYSIDALTGALSIVKSTFFLSPSAIAADPSGHFVYATAGATRRAGSVFSYALDAATGMLSQTGTAAAGVGPCSIAVDPGDQFVYVTNCLSNDVSVYAIDSTTGALAAVGSPISAGAKPAAIAIDPSGKYAYVANAQSNDVSTYSIDRRTGTLVSIGSNVAAGSMPSALAVDPSGQFVYVTNQFSASVSVYAIDAATGSLSSPVLPVTTGSFPAAIIVQ